MCPVPRSQPPRAPGTTLQSDNRGNVRVIVGGAYHAHRTHHVKQYLHFRRCWAPGYCLPFINRSIASSMLPPAHPPRRISVANKVSTYRLPPYRPRALAAPNEPPHMQTEARRASRRASTGHLERGHPHDPIRGHRPAEFNSSHKPSQISMRGAVPEIASPAGDPRHQQPHQGRTHAACCHTPQFHMPFPRPRILVTCEGLLGPTKQRSARVCLMMQPSMSQYPSSIRYTTYIPALGYHRLLLPMCGVGSN
eukprot:jgi/Mesvir1/18003/Mv26533-RA.1